jgi:riboflavin biosynthesis pyrimidine reductase
VCAKRNLKPDAERVVAAEEAIAQVSRQVKFSVAEYPVSVYVSRFTDDINGRYFVPNYQRNLAWNDDQKSQFVESLLVGLPIPFLFFYQTSDGRMEIVDGSQRMRAMRAFLKEGLRLKELILVPELNGFTFDDLPQDRQNKLEDITIRTIVLDTDTDPATRAEMFARINRSGTSANEAEVRRGSLPGPATDLIKELAESESFVQMTPLTEKAINQREREELVTRFFAYTEKNDTEKGRFPGYRDRPKKFLYDYLKFANEQANADPNVVPRLREEFERMLGFVNRSFPNGFRKSVKGQTIPRVRFEAISVGSALALRDEPSLSIDPQVVGRRMEERHFDKIVVSDGANVRSRLEGRIDLVRSILTRR